MKKVDGQFDEGNYKLIDKTKQEIERDFWLSNYKYKALNEKMKEKNQLIELNNKRLDRNLELVDEESDEADTEYIVSPP